MEINHLLPFLHQWLTDLGSLALSFGSTRITLADVLRAAVVVVAACWGTGLLVRTLESRIRRSQALDYNVRELLIKFLKISIYFTALVAALGVVGIDITAFAVFGGALGVGLGLGLQRITANFVSGVTLLLEKSVKLGDFIQIGTDVQGFVRALNIRYTLIETAKGTEILIPNETLTSTNVTNWTLSNHQGRVEILFTVPYETPLGTVRPIALRAANTHPKCLADPAAECFLRHFRDLGYEYMLVFWVANVTDGMLGPQHDVMERLATLLAEQGIHFARGHANPLDNR